MMRWMWVFLALFSVSVQAKQAAVAMPDRYSADVARSVLEQGGHAVDAAVASGFVLAVTYPEAGNIGGGGFMTLFSEGQPYFLDYRETAPALAHRDLYLDESGEVIAHQSLVGYRASGVPGTVMGLWQAHQRFGRLPWSELLKPAIRLAEEGFVVPEQMHSTSQWFKRWIEGKSKQPLNFSQYFSVQKGQVFKQKRLAKALKLIANQGPKAFYEGDIAKALVEQLKVNQGLISMQDLSNYRAVWREPIQFDWQGLQVVSAPPPSSGGIALAQLLGLYESHKPRLNPQTLSERIHMNAEFSKRVYADRAEYLGDTDFVEVPIKALTDKTHIQSRGGDIELNEISETQSIKPSWAESPETTHFSIVDGEGNAVSNTYTLNMPFGSGVVIDEFGFLMNDEMDDFSKKPGVANAFGVVGGTANAIEPGKRMLSSMSPTIVLKDGKVDMVVGTPGGSSIITSVYQVILNHYAYGLTAQANVDAPRYHHQLWPKNRLDYHPSVPDEAAAELELMGYELRKNNYLGDVQLIVNQKGQWQGASDYRWRGFAQVFDLP